MFGLQVVPILRFKDTVALYPTRRKDFFLEKTQFLVESLLHFLKTFDEARRFIQIPLPKRKDELRSTKSNDKFLPITLKTSLIIQTHKLLIVPI